MRLSHKLIISTLTLTAVWTMPTDARSSDLVLPQLLMDVYEGSGNSAEFHLGKRILNLGGRAYFDAGADSSTGVLLHSDGTAGGTGIVAESSQVLGGAVFGGHKLIVTGHPEFQVLRVNEDDQGIQVIGDFVTIYNARLLEYAGHLYFSCRSFDIFWGLCRTEGTAEGTSVEPLVGVEAGRIVYFANLASAMYFVARTTSPIRHFLWKKESPESAPIMLLELGSCDFFFWPQEAIIFPEGLLLPCGVSNGTIHDKLSVLDGKTDALVGLAVPDIWTPFIGLRPVIIDDRVIVFAPSTNHENLGLFQVDGRFVSEINIPVLDEAQLLKPVSNANAAFLNHRTDGVIELWITNGTEAGTSLVTEFQGDTAVPNFSESYPTDLDHLFFRVSLENKNEVQLWYVTDVDGINARPIASLPQNGDFFVPLGRNLLGFAGFDDYGVEPSVLKIESRIGSIFCDGFE